MLDALPLTPVELQEGRDNGVGTRLGRLKRSQKFSVGLLDATSLAQSDIPINSKKKSLRRAESVWT
jgi:hypothetical protein